MRPARSPFFLAAALLLLMPLEGPAAAAEGPALQRLRSRLLRRQPQQGAPEDRFLPEEKQASPRWRPAAGPPGPPAPRGPRLVRPKRLPPPPPLSIDLTFHLLREMVSLSRAQSQREQARLNQRLLDQVGK
ncbi:urocortin [Sceloporus undulatus]|uniref:urocortin n=1 Tax=Sceloporus undulatus TaxID=8520 RepID=UPI001C4B50F0|nr:urocortin [Sceloporus undulatus]